VINPTITTKFVGKFKDQKIQHSSIGKFYSVEYALIKVHGAIVPKNLGNYFKDNIIQKFEDKREKLFECLWEGTNNLVTRSKFPQRSILYLEIIYISSIYNDLPILVKENDQMKKPVSSLVEKPFEFDKLISAIEKRINNIKKIRIACCDEILQDIEEFVKNLGKINEKQKEEDCDVEKSANKKIVIERI
ncbi:MAG: hypothetical protein M3Z01_06155, partial [Thermoproteota archaeon]|nr:hypothetical protein [Thermoproteota archaeon]